MEYKLLVLSKKTLKWFLSAGIVIAVMFGLNGGLAAQTPSGSPIVLPTPTVSPRGINPIDFRDVMPAAFEPGWIWNCLGEDTQGRIYLCMGGYLDLNPDVAVFRYTPLNGSREFLTTLRAISQAQSNLEEGEPFFKGHSHIVELNGKMYLSTQGFHDITDQPSQMDDIRGGHLFEFDPVTNQWRDLSKTDTGGVSAPHQGIIAIDSIPARNQIAGVTVPLGDILIYDLTEGKTIGYYPAPERPLELNISREVLATDEAVYTQAKFGPMLKLDLQTGDYKPLNTIDTTGFFTAMVYTADKKHAYFITYHGYLYHFDVEQEQLVEIGLFKSDPQPGEGRDDTYMETLLYSLAMSPDERTLYALFTGKNKGFYAYDRASGKITKLDEFGADLGPDYSGSVITGRGVWDGQGYLYLARFGENTLAELLRLDLTKFASHTLPSS